MINQWCRRVMNTEVYNFVIEHHPDQLDVLEISGNGWRDLGFRSYSSVHYPAFDICMHTTGAEYDLIIAEQVFEHIEQPVLAAQNVRNMLRMNGIFVITTPFLIKYHPTPVDLWRWTEEGLKNLLCSQGFNDVQTYSWGNKECLIANLDSWVDYDPVQHSDLLYNDPEFPIVVWGYARK